LEDVSIMDLCEAFGRLLNSIGQAAGHQVTYDDTPIQLHAEDIADRLGREGPMTLETLFSGRSNRSEMIGLFLATLELVRDKRVRVQQSQIGGTITLEVIPEEERQAMEAEDDSPTDWTDPETGEMQYDWPDEEARKRAEKRKKQREQERLKQMRGDDQNPTSPQNDADANARDADDEPFDPEQPDQPNDDTRV
jgi:segregation and condensation protein A